MHANVYSMWPVVSLDRSRCHQLLVSTNRALATCDQWVVNDHTTTTHGPINLHRESEKNAPASLSWCRDDAINLLSISTARRYAIARYMLLSFVCLSVCHKPALYQNGYIESRKHAHGLYSFFDAKDLSKIPTVSPQRGR